MLSEVSQAERVNYHGFTYLRSIRNSTENIRRRKGEMKGAKSKGGDEP